ncbi:MAG TPA: T9SS type A sorting domain-containing protein [Bacteroidia bacterium]|mgnify:CR=1 FL=1|nr:T9SS type A sorting domain-containing protein [Bacteroidia bacterium]HRS59255.1 T9SS type A sorting domain-containing protein [Bacteroidia bacterium]HRU67155.1 T9SS type A sorting domain-containing protein [Bacteroidia bacterium]
MRIYSNIIFWFFWLISCSGVMAQNPANDFFQQYKEIINEKLKAEAGLQNILNEEDKLTSSPLFSRSLGNEKQVSNTSLAESEIHAVINPTDSNNWVLAPIRLLSVGGFTLPIYYTKDFGKTWLQSSWKASPPFVAGTVLGGGDPVFAFDADGKLYFSWIHLYSEGSNSYSWALLWAYSEDGGETWKTNTPYTIISSSGSSLYTIPIIADKQWMAADVSNSVFRNTLYVAYLKADMTNQQMRIVVSRKPADSLNFIPAPVEVSTGSFAEVQFSQIVVDNYGYVHVTFYGSYDKSVYSLFHSISKDGGETFSVPQKVTDIQKVSSITGIKSNRIYPAPALAVDQSNSPYSGRLYLSFTALGISSDHGTGSDIYLTWSSDTGATWTTPVIINDDDKQHLSEQFYSSLSINPQGVVSLSWYDGRHSTFASSNEIVQYYVAHSFDGGETFTKNYNVSSVFTDFQTIGYKNNQFGIGEYNQLLSTNGYCIPVWSDGRKGNGDLDVYIAITEIQENPSYIKEIQTLIPSVKNCELSPNPVATLGKLHFTLDEEILLKISLSNSTGKILKVYAEKRFDPGTYHMEIDCRKYPSGIYYLSLETANGIVSKRLIINR